jgi:ASC-1-like (ASCH) protein
MLYKLDINDRAFKAIKNLEKRIEIRVTKIGDKSFDYNIIKKNDKIEFTSYSGDKIICLVENVNHYKTIEELLTLEGTRYTLSSTNDFDEGVKSINSIPNYKESMVKNGVYAIHLKYIKSISD